MSVIKVNKIENTGTTNGGVEIDSSGHVTVDDQQIPTAGALSNRNLVQNGAMTVSQRSTSKSSLTSGNNYILDRWRTYIQNIGTYTISQASDAPAGFKYSYKIQCTTADASPAAADDMSFYCPFEGQDLQQLKKGTSSAESLTLSFWIKSNKTATGQVNIRDQDNNRLISGTYTVSASGTWEYKTITFPGDTTGALDNDNAASISIQWYLDSGSNFSSGSMNSTWGTDSANKRNVNNFGLASSTDNYWQITGIQLEVGEKATPFEHRSFGDDLRKCMRYYQKSYNYSDAPGSATSTGTAWLTVNQGGGRLVHTAYLKERMRATPTFKTYDWDGNIDKIRTQGGNNKNASQTYSSETAVIVDKNDSSGTEVIFQYTVEAEL